MARETKNPASQTREPDGDDDKLCSAGERKTNKRDQSLDIKSKRLRPLSFDLSRRNEFERVAMPHTQSLFRAALRLAPERAAAEDMVQETLLHAWNAFDQFERGTNCKAWLFRILINISRQHLRRSLSAPATLPLEGNASRKVLQLCVAAPQFASAEVLSALDMLSIDHRLVLTLAVVEGFTVKRSPKCVLCPSARSCLD